MLYRPPPRCQLIGAGAFACDRDSVARTAQDILSSAELFVQAGQILFVCVDVYICLDVNQGGTNLNRCAQRLVILHAQAY